MTPQDDFHLTQFSLNPKSFVVSSQPRNWSSKWHLSVICENVLSDFWVGI